MTKVAVIGSGAWGTAIATVLAHNKHDVVLWSHEEEVVQSIQQECINRLYLPEVKLCSSIVPTTNYAQAFDGVEWVFEAVPVKYMRQVLMQLKPYYKQTQKWVVLSKGIEQETVLVPTQILDDVFSDSVQSIALMGPSFAKDVVNKQLTAVNGASVDPALSDELKALIENEYFKVFPSDDSVGVQLCAALKNAITLGIGILDGAGCTDNTKTFFLVQSLQEMREFIIACGGKAQTVDGLAGVGDLVLTALGKHSRNLQAGRKLGAGQSPQQIMEVMRCMPEGFNTVQSMNALIEKNNLHLSLLKSLSLVVAGEKTYEALLATLSES